MADSRSNTLFASTTTILIALLCMTALGDAAHAQSYSVLHAFSSDGQNPFGGVIVDAAGNLYGTTYEGGPPNANCQNGCGTVFQLKHRSSGWILQQLYAFKGAADGEYPAAGVVFGPDGALYGTTQGTIGCGLPNTQCGTVFRLTPPVTICATVSCPWIKTILYTFSGGQERMPGYGNLVFDHAGSIYGTTQIGGNGGAGAVYKLTHSNGVWTESLVYSFFGQGGDGSMPTGGVIFDQSGNIYGTTDLGGSVNCGIVFRLSPSGGGWTETILHDFQRSTGPQLDGCNPFTSLTIDSSGTLYGTTTYGPSGYLGTIFKITPPYNDASFSTVYAALNVGQLGGPGILSPVTLDPAGHVFGAEQTGSGGTFGDAFELQTIGLPLVLHQFDGDDGDGPMGNIARDASGNLYGVTFAGGQHLSGVVWQITP